MRPSIVFVFSLLFSFQAFAFFDNGVSYGDCDDHFKTFKGEVGVLLAKTFGEGNIEQFTKELFKSGITSESVSDGLRACLPLMHYIVAQPNKYLPNGKYNENHLIMLKMLWAMGFEVNPRSKSPPTNPGVTNVPAMAYLGGTEDLSLLKWMLDADASIYEGFQDGGFWHTTMEEIVVRDANLLPHSMPTTNFFLLEYGYHPREGGLCRAFSKVPDGLFDALNTNEIVEWFNMIESLGFRLGGCLPLDTPIDESFDWFSNN